MGNIPNSDPEAPEACKVPSEWADRVSLLEPLLNEAGYFVSWPAFRVQEA